VPAALRRRDAGLVHRLVDRRALRRTGPPMEERPLLLQLAHRRRLSRMDQERLTTRRAAVLIARHRLVWRLVYRCGYSCSSQGPDRHNTCGCFRRVGGDRRCCVSGPGRLRRRRRDRSHRCARRTRFDRSRDRPRFLGRRLRAHRWGFGVTRFRGCVSQHGRRPLGRRPFGNRRCGCRLRREQGKWIDVPLVVVRHPGPEVNVRPGQVDHAARADRADHRRLSYVRTSLDGDRPEMHERRGVTEGGLNRHGLATRRDGAGERDDAGGGRQDWTAARRAQVDPPMLTGRIRVRTVEGERSQHRSVDRPRPGTRNRHGECTGTDDQQNNHSPHDSLLVANFENGSDGSKSVSPLSRLATKYDGRARCAEHRSDARRSRPRDGAPGRQPRARPRLGARPRSRAPSSPARARA
jgi:hypothetical protein